MITRYREVFFGLLFGVAATALDIIMHARMQEHSFAEELIHPDLEMLFYRVLFLAFGLALGVLLWRTNVRQRESRIDLEGAAGDRSGVRSGLKKEIAKIRSRSMALMGTDERFGSPTG